MCVGLSLLWAFCRAVALVLFVSVVLSIALVLPPALVLSLALSPLVILFIPCSLSLCLEWRLLQRSLVGLLHCLLVLPLRRLLRWIFFSTIFLSISL